MKETALQKAIAVSRIEPKRWLAIHEFGLFSVSQNALAARLREATRAGVYIVRWRGRVKEWNLAENVHLGLDIEPVYKGLGIPSGPI